MVHSIPDMEDLRCHEVARAVAIVLGLEVQDGKYGMVEHSWVLLPRRTYCSTILDVYSVGRLPLVQLIHHTEILPHYDSYKAGDPRDVVEQEIVDLLVRILREAGFED
jgi:hypothetical protein